MIFEDNRIRFDVPIQLKKITGTRFPALFGYSPYKTKTGLYLEMSELYVKPTAVHKALQYGLEEEKHLIEYFKKEFNQELFTYEGLRNIYDDPIFGGRPDGVLKNGDVLEIKTTNKEDMFANNKAHTSYFLQTLLYAYLEHITNTRADKKNIYILIKFRDVDIDPIIDSYTLNFIKKQEFNLFDLEIMEEQLQDYIDNLEKYRIEHTNIDIDLNFFEALRSLYTIYMITSPKLDIKDSAFVNFTQKKIQPTPFMNELITKIRDIESNVNKIEQNGKPLYDELKKLKEILKEEMQNYLGDMIDKVSINDEIGNFELRRSYKTSFNTNKLKKILTSKQLDEITEVKTVLTLRQN